MNFNHQTVRFDQSKYSQYLELKLDGFTSKINLKKLASKTLHEKAKSLKNNINDNDCNRDKLNF